MNTLRRIQSEFPTTEQSAVRPVFREPLDTVRVAAPMNRDDIPTVRAPAMVTLSPDEGAGLYDMSIPASPRVPFIALRTRSTQRRRWRAEVREEWVKLSDADERRS